MAKHPPELISSLPLIPTRTSRFLLSCLLPPSRPPLSPSYPSGAGSVDVQGQLARNMQGRGILARAEELVSETLSAMLECGADASLLPTAHAMLQQVLSEVNKLLLALDTANEGLQPRVGPV